MKIEFQNIPVSEKLDQVVENSMEQIYTQQKRKRVKSWAVKGSAIAAALVMVIVTCINNPTIAAELPFIGHIFERMQDDFELKGDYSEVAKPLETETVGYELDNAENAEEMEKISEYTQTVNGITVTLSEVYCNALSLNVTVQIKSEEPLPEVHGFFVDTVEQYSFTPSVTSDGFYIEGGKIDDYTYAGVMRFDLTSRNVDTTEFDAILDQLETTGNIDENSRDSEMPWEYLKKVKIPEHFTLDLCIENIVGDLVDTEPIDWGKTQEELEAMSDEEWEQFMLQYEAEHPDLYDDWSVTYEGQWKFALDITMDLSETQVVELNDYNELGIGFEKVVKDRFQITMIEAYKDESLSNEYFPVMLDADGRLMESASGSVTNIIIGDRDVSKVDIFLFDYLEWMDGGLKGDCWQLPNALTEDGRTYRELLLERCVYHKEIVFE